MTGEQNHGWEPDGSTEPAGWGAAPSQQPVQPVQPGRPRWVVVLMIAGLVVLALIVLMLLTGHGPGRHLSAPPGQFWSSAATVAG